MKSGKIHTYIGCLLALLISTSLTVSTLHSHGHIEWHHPDTYTDTGHCLTVDSTLCPICGFLFSADITYPETPEVCLYDTGNVPQLSLLPVQQPHFFYTRERAPPVLI